MRKFFNSKAFEIAYAIWTIFFGLYDMAMAVAGQEPVIFFIFAAGVQWICLAFWYFIWGTHGRSRT